MYIGTHLFKNIIIQYILKGYPYRFSHHSSVCHSSMTRKYNYAPETRSIPSIIDIPVRPSSMFALCLKKFYI